MLSDQLPCFVFVASHTAAPSQPLSGFGLVRPGCALASTNCVWHACWKALRHSVTLSMRCPEAVWCRSCAVKMPALPPNFR